MRHWLHKSTWVALAIVAAALIGVQFRFRCLTEDFATFCSVYYGWPVYAIEVTEHYATHARTYDARLAGLLVDGATILLLVLSTGIAVEQWSRRTLAPWQFSLQSLVVLPAAVLSALMFYRNERQILRDSPVIIVGELSAGPMSTLRFMPFWIVAPILFGIACASVAAFWLASIGLTFAMKRMWTRTDTREA